MRYEQDSGVKRVGDSGEYKVVVAVYLTAEEKDLWGSRKAHLILETAAERQPRDVRQVAAPLWWEES